MNTTKRYENGSYAHWTLYLDSLEVIDPSEEYRKLDIAFERGQLSTKEVRALTLRLEAL